MPIKLVPPRPGKSPYWSVRGTHHRVYVDRSTKATGRVEAARFLKALKDDIERGVFARPGEPTFLDASVAYMAATGIEHGMEPLIERLGHLPLKSVTQQVIDETAIALHPKNTAATRNREVYTPISAVLKHAGIETAIRRPKGWRGTKRTDWMTPEQAFRLIGAAKAKDPELGIFLTFLLYTGTRLGEALALPIDRLSISESFAYVAETKNEDPRAVHLPPVLVAALAGHPRGLDRSGERVFRFTKCGRLYTWMKDAKKAAGVDLDFVSFHTFRHTWATWMRRYGGLDTRGLVGTGAWRDATSAARYEHVVTTEEARRADMLPVENPGKISVRKTGKAKSRVKTKAG